ncbi:MAG: desulfoferrodoxin FeS4 iron-binding domain-containing protein [Clostridiaceae bacterium]|jgi:superoxide reductase|nr:desulfoferrodoxin FeS4 iron-binding domain-containing protein [Clostridiaceae bacterium]
MTKKLELYRCNLCGNLVQVILDGGGELVCCGEKMELVPTNNVEESIYEKHIPVFTKEGENTLVKVGKVLHPMNDDHYIMFIEVIDKHDDSMCLKYLHPGQEAQMIITKELSNPVAKAFCNLHGLFEGEMD